MKWNRGQIDISIVDETVAWHRYFIGCGDGIPNIRRLIVPNLDMISAVRSRNCDGTIARHRFDGHAVFFDTVRTIYAEMSLAIHRHRFRKDCRPVDTPISEDCSRVACDRKQARRAMNPREPAPLAELANNSFLLIIRVNNRFARNTETTREFRFGLALGWIFTRHGDSDSQLGASQRKTKVNLGPLNKVSAMNGPAFAKATPKVLREQAARPANNTNHQMVGPFLELARTGTPASTAL